MGFINRTVELDRLQRLWDSGTAQLAVVYGKRRVGKTELIRQFLLKNSGIYYLADKRTHHEQLLEFGRVVGDFFDDLIVRQNGFIDWLQAFQYLEQRSHDRQFIVAIDEYPYLVESARETSSLFQKGWDQYLKQSRVCLILCGSSIAMMESEMSSRAPLYGRMTARFLVEPMDVYSSQDFFPKRQFADFLTYYAITGGMPAYLQAFSGFENVEEAATALCLDKNGLYANEVNMMLRQELRTPNTYFAILKAIAGGKTRISEIANDGGFTVTLVSKYLRTLEGLQFVEREVPVTEDKPHKSKKGIFVLRENFVRFWFQYIYAFSSDLAIGNFRQVQKKFRAESHFLESIAYEQISRRTMWDLSDRLFSFEKAGRYWDSDIEIDGVGYNAHERKIAFMEAKWSDKKMGPTILNKLRMKAARVAWMRDKREEYFVLFSKAGFESELVSIASEDPHVVLVQQVTVMGR
ncbi:hypothetical protein AUK40_04070 [Candidatus Wirthbacteria bacterium CG2_30_54_11]|uniref:ATPase n=1 Tax=Candidatus Wirthbacteria bacterium CG2_30_54_11 TaxID=1817892 RepID=A0A1J5IJ03_9BACT|nr:MAG: hypothetical protein AUK40_04070 [Candidatus Wirthbacteria bacterium CG2_30_54_11]